MVQFSKNFQVFKHHGRVHDYMTVNPVRSLKANELILQATFSAEDARFQWETIPGMLRYGLIEFFKCVSDIQWMKGWKNSTMKVLTSVKQFYMTIKMKIHSSGQASRDGVHSSFHLQSSFVCSKSRLMIEIVNFPERSSGKLCYVNKNIFWTVQILQLGLKRSKNYDPWQLRNKHCYT